MLSYSYGHIQKIEFNGVNIRLKKFGVKKDPIWGTNDFIWGKKHPIFGLRKNLFPILILPDNPC